MDSLLCHDEAADRGILNQRRQLIGLGFVCRCASVYAIDEVLTHKEFGG